MTLFYPKTRHFKKTTLHDLLLENGAALDPLDKNKMTPLMLAAKNGHEQSVEFFLRKKASQVATSSDNLNALEYCILGNHIECARRILYSDNWKDSMRNSRCLKGNDVETPMRLLLQEIPELARIVLNRSVTHETKGEKSGEIVCDFEFVEDLYRIEGWKPENIGRLDDDADSELKTIKVPYWGRNEGKKSGFLKNTSEMYSKFESDQNQEKGFWEYRVVAHKCDKNDRKWLKGAEKDQNRHFST